ncbi:hypothetical protein COO60DRAFT_1484958, partial [Scenedesmus sp. NREL 46B-D3]
MATSTVSAFGLILATVHLHRLCFPVWHAHWTAMCQMVHSLSTETSDHSARHATRCLCVLAACSTRRQLFLAMLLPYPAVHGTLACRWCTFMCLP